MSARSLFPWSAPATRSRTVFDRQPPVPALAFAIGLLVTLGWMLTYGLAAPRPGLAAADASSPGAPPRTALAYGPSVAVTPTCTPVQTVSLSTLAPAPLYVDEPVTFRVDLAPEDLGLPLNYLIQIDFRPVASGSTNIYPLFVTHTFRTTGTHRVSARVGNCGMSQAEAPEAWLKLTLYDRPCIAVTGASLSQVSPDPVVAGSPATFRLDLDPGDVSLPFTYTLHWGDDTPGVVLTGRLAPLLLTHTFTTSGQITVEAGVWNCDMAQGEAVSATLPVVVQPFWRVYLPVVRRSG